MTIAELLIRANCVGTEEHKQYERITCTVRYHAVNAAIGIMAESEATEHHAERLAWAKKALHGQIDMPTVVIGTLTECSGKVEDFTIASLNTAFEAVLTAFALAESA